MPKNQEVYLSWEAPEFRHYPKNFGWYLTLLIVAGLVIFYQLLQKDLFGAFTVVVLTFFIWAFARQQPKTVTINITDKGLNIDDTHIPYHEIKHFWVVDTENHRTLNLETNAYLNRIVILQLEDQDPDELRDFLLEVLPEHPEPRETLVQRIMHRLKF